MEMKVIINVVFELKDVESIFIIISIMYVIVFVWDINVIVGYYVVFILFLFSFIWWW